MKSFKKIIITIFVLLTATVTASASVKRILYIDSYNAGYPWSDGITEAIEAVLAKSNTNIKIHRMDTKRNPGEKFKLDAALKAKGIIDSYRPDIVIASDDNASKYLIMKYYKDARLPFVFCGVNYTADAYGFPYSNVTGMVEVPPVIKLVYSLKHFVRITSVGYLAADTLTERKDGEFAKRDIRENFHATYVKNFKQWKKAFIDMQKKVDVLIVGNNGGIKGWNDQQAEAFVMAKTRIPTGCLLDWMTPFALLGATRLASEQGTYAANTALKILDGIPAENIPIVRNSQADIIINKRLAQNLGLKIPRSFERIASRIIE